MFYFSEDSSEELDEWSYGSRGRLNRFGGGGDPGNPTQPPVDNTGPTVVLPWSSTLSPLGPITSEMIYYANQDASVSNMLVYNNFDDIAEFSVSTVPGRYLYFFYRAVSPAMAAANPALTQITFKLGQSFQPIRLQPFGATLVGSEFLAGGTGFNDITLNINTNTPTYEGWGRVALIITNTGSGPKVRLPVKDVILPMPDNIERTFIKAQDLDYTLNPGSTPISFGPDGQMRSLNSSTRFDVEFTINTSFMPRFYQNFSASEISAEWTGHMTFGKKEQTTSFKKYIDASVNATGKTVAQIDIGARTITTVNGNEITKFSVGRNMAGNQGNFNGIWVFKYIAPP